MTKSSERCRLMIVDDDESLGGTLLHILQKAGYETRWVETGKEALAQMTAGGAEPFADILLVDIRLPDMNGLDVVRESRKANPDIGAIVMTGYTDNETAVRALNEGAFAYLQKPYNIDEVKATVARLVERQVLLRQNKALVRQLQEANVELERKVAERTQALQSANLDLASTIEKLKEAADAKTAFVSMVSHELRTPLTVIEGFTETLIDKIERLQKEDIVRYLGIIHTDTLRLTRLIQNMLDLSAVQAKGITIHPAPVRLKALAESITQGLEMIKTGMRFEVVFPNEIEIISDKDCVQQILVNLLSNAVKYSPSPGTIRIKGTDQGSTVQVSVIDHGPGIRDTEQAKIFQAFYRSSDAVNRKTPGTGLGLTITRAIVEALGGSIGVESKLGEGAIFTFTLPKVFELSKNNGLDTGKIENSSLL